MKIRGREWRFEIESVLMSSLKHKDKKSLIPIIWDDMLRKIPAEKLQESGVGQIGVEPMVWVYVEDIDR